MFRWVLEELIVGAWPREAVVGLSAAFAMWAVPAAMATAYMALT